MSEIRNVITEDWSGHSHGEVEVALKGKLSEMDQSIEEAAQAGYAPPDGGIPKTDLAQSVQTSLDNADSAVQDSQYVHTDNNYTDSEKAKLSGLQNYDDAALQSAINSLQTALNALVNGQSVTDAIDTFNEVTAFLNGINTDDPTLFNQLKSLSDAITALESTLSSKANAADVYSKSQVEQMVEGKQDALVWDDEPGNTDNPVKSRGIKQAIDNVMPTINENGKWVIGGVATNHDAQGPMGNITIEDANDMVALIVNDLTTGGQANFLSAEMGKALLSVLLQIFGNLGEYAFPNGKPTLNFNTQISFPINYSTSDLHVTYADGQGNTAPSMVDLLGRLEIQLGTDDDLYVINESAVHVYVGGNEVSNAYDPTTDKIIIPEVYGNVVIVAQAMTYVGYGEQNSPLVLMFDGKNQGSTANQWENLANANKPLVLSGGYTKNTDNVQFGGTDGRGIIQNFGTDFPYNTATMEVVLSFGSLPSSDTYLFGSGNEHNALLFIGPESDSTGRRVLAAQTKGEHGSASSSLKSARMDTAVNSFPYNINQIISLSRQGMRYTLNKDQLAEVNGSYITVGDSQSTFNAAGYIFVSGCTTRAGAYYGPFQGKMYCIRAYTRALTELEVAQNYNVDKKRFNIA